jgi:hypothetical protein
MIKVLAHRGRIEVIHHRSIGDGRPQLYLGETRVPDAGEEDIFVFGYFDHVGAIGR